MLNKKLAFLVAFVSLGWLQFSNIQVHHLEEPGNFKLMYSITRIVSLISQLAEGLNYGIEPANTRHLIYGLSTLDKKSYPNVKISETKIAGVNVRIFKPYSSINSKDLPIIIYYHGGGFFMEADTSDYLAQLTNRLNMITISVDYRMAPEHPFPTPTNDCFAVTKYVLESTNEFGDTNKVTLFGDSAGGNVVAVMTQKLLTEKRKLPKLQVLMYPWLQMYNNRMPSSIKYAKNGIADFNWGKLIGWYLGYSIVPMEIQEILLNNSHTLLVNDPKLKQKFESYTDVNQIPKKYKSGRNYYETYNIIKDSIFPKSMESTSLLKKDKKLKTLLASLFTPQMSPGLASDEMLKGLPKAYFILCEVDPLKDEGLIYSERLRKAGVTTDLRFYENCFHGVGLISDKLDSKITKVMFNDLVDYISANIH